jgi:hypothetical protein
MNSLDPHVELFRRLVSTVASSPRSPLQEKGCGMVKLTPEQQQAFVAEQPQVFSPVQGGWGRMGCNFVHLREADEALISSALYTAYHNLQKKQSDKKSSRSAPPAKPIRRRLQ